MATSACTDVDRTQEKADVKSEIKSLRAKSKSSVTRFLTAGPSKPQTSSTSASRERRPADSGSTGTQRSRHTLGLKTLTGKDLIMELCRHPLFLTRITIISTQTTSII